MRGLNESRSNAPFFPVVILILLGIPFLVGLLVQYAYLQDLERVSSERLNLYEMTLESELRKYEYLPFLISENGVMAKFLTTGGDPMPINRLLQRVNTIAGSSVVYILDPRGIVRATSNWNKPNNFVSLDLSFRPYFKDAMQGREGKFFGVGITVGVPGFYISHPIRDNDAIIGVAVAKIALSPLENIWREGGETLFVSDSNGVIVLTSRPSWKYKTLTALDETALRKIREKKNYPGFELQHLPSHTRTRLGFVNEFVIGKERFLRKSRPIPGTDWGISYLTSQGALWERTLGASLTTFVLLGLGILTRLFLRERKLKQLSRQQAVEANHIRDINRQLAQEIEDRKRTEHELRAAQEELVQAGKLAALGEMATAIAHELNQPIAAATTYIASCKLMLKRNKLDELAPTLEKVSSLGDRMAKVTGSLKTFARRSSEKHRRIDIRQAVKEAVNLMKHQFHIESCGLKLTMPGKPIFVVGDQMRIEQVLINLLRNALDALHDTESPQVGIKVATAGGMATITVWDNGPGVPEEVGSRIFEPFVTTKKEGIGVGLGLSISYKIIKEMGGHLRVAGRADGGAEFSIQLPLSQQQQEG